MNERNLRILVDRRILYLRDTYLLLRLRSAYPFFSFTYSRSALTGYSSRSHLELSRIEQTHERKGE